MPAVWALPECCGPAMRLCVQTSTKTKEENPVWDEEFDLVVDEPVSCFSNELGATAGVSRCV